MIIRLRRQAQTFEDKRDISFDRLFGDGQLAFARAQPRSKDAAATPQRQSPILNLLALLTWTISMAPVFAAAALVAAFGTGWLIVALPAAVAYSGGLWMVSLRSVGRWLDQHEAALLVRIQGG